MMPTRTLTGPSLYLQQFSIIFQRINKEPCRLGYVRCSKYVGFFYKQSPEMNRSVGCCSAKLG
jgi:hypothetical protein